MQWTGVPQGAYALTAVATDNGTATTTSTPVIVTVAPAVVQVYFIEVDHLNTPRVVSNATSTTVWRWDQQEPFGVNVPDENPSGLGAFEFPLRLPGQYFDKETNLAYNYHRDYDAGLGRYTKSDPIGLRGGLNTYLYVGGNPLSRGDPRGEQVAIPVAVGAGALICALTPGCKKVVSNAIMACIRAVDTLIFSTSGDEEQADSDPCKGLREQLAAHEKKLQDYINDPHGSDNQGFLGQGRDKQVIEGRIRNLIIQIENFRKLLAECESKNAK